MFRPEENAKRAANGCLRLSMPEIKSEIFLDGVKSIRYKIDLNKCVNFITEGSSIKQNFKDVV